SRLTMRAGTNRLAAQYKDWPRLEKTLVVRPGETVSALFHFDHAQVNLSSDPPGATVTLADNRLVGVTPTNFSWPAGMVTFMLGVPGYENTEVTMNLVDGANTNLNRVLVARVGSLE